ncbi:MAG: prepilin peptidase, partial [Planctomycetota bacterium]
MNFGVTWFGPLLGAGDLVFPDEPPLWPAVVFCAFWFAVLGGIFGSFLNVVVYRLPRGLNLAYPPSHCPRCKAPIRARDNIPVLGWLLLGGRCRDCRSPISPRYPAVEAVCGIILLLIYSACEQYGWTESLVYGRFDARFFGLTLAMSQVTLVTLSILAAALIAYDGSEIPSRLWWPAVVLTATALVVSLLPFRATLPAMDKLGALLIAPMPVVPSLTQSAVAAWGVWLPTLGGGLLWMATAILSENAGRRKPATAFWMGTVAGAAFGTVPVAAAGLLAVVTGLFRRRAAPRERTPPKNTTPPPNGSVAQESTPHANQEADTSNPQVDIACALPM